MKPPNKILCFFAEHIYYVNSTSKCKIHNTLYRIFFGGVEEFNFSFNRWSLPVIFNIGINLANLGKS